MQVTMTMPIVLTLEMGPNARLHHRAKASVVRMLREDARRAAMSHVNDLVWNVKAADAGLYDGGPVTMDVEVEWPKGRKFWDEDNLISAMKACRDGIADALWGGEDKHVRVGAVTQTRGDGGLKMTFRVGEP